MIAKKKIFGVLALTASVMLVGCASAPGPVSADVPLVHPNYTVQDQGQVISIAPNKTIMPGQTISFADATWQVGQGYFSASQQQCFALHRLNTPRQIAKEARVCQQHSQWIYFPSVLRRSLSGDPES